MAEYANVNQQFILMKTALYVIVDGMTETGTNGSSLQNSVTPNMDWIAAAGTIGFYVPEKETDAAEPKTDVVVPAFFGLSVSVNPGRVGLELLDLGLQLVPETFCFSSKICTPNMANESDWRKFTIVAPPILAQLEARLRSDAEACGAVCIRSAFSNYGEKYLFANCPSSSYLDLCEAVRHTLSSFSFAPLVAEVHKVPTAIQSAEGSRKDIVFLGWAKGSLRGAFRLLGAACNPFTRELGSYFNWEAYSGSFSFWSRPLLQQTERDGKTFILYTKETAFASRQGNRGMKIQGIEFMDRMLGEALNLLNDEVIIVVISDHSCDIGGCENPALNSLYAVAAVSANTPIKKNVPHLCERAVQKRSSSPPISQCELVDMISRLR